MNENEPVLYGISAGVVLLLILSEVLGWSKLEAKSISQLVVGGKLHKSTTSPDLEPGRESPTLIDRRDTADFEVPCHK